MVEVLRALPPRRVKWRRGPLRVFGYAMIHAWMRVCKKAGIPYRMRHEAGRHSFATVALIRQKIDPVTVARLGGCSNPVALMNKYAPPENLSTVAEQAFGKSDTKLTRATSGEAKKLRRTK
jgi:hypothetical protein